MNLDNASLFGIAVLISLSLLGGYLILLQIREHTREHPDPKLTYLPKAEFESTFSYMREQLDALTDLVHRNAEQIAALTAQTQITLQRLAELTVKIDRLQERSYLS